MFIKTLTFLDDKRFCFNNVRVGKHSFRLLSIRRCHRTMPVLSTFLVACTLNPTQSEQFSLREFEQATLASLVTATSATRINNDDSPPSHTRQNSVIDEEFQLTEPSSQRHIEISEAINTNAISNQEGTVYTHEDSGLQTNALNTFHSAIEQIPAQYSSTSRLSSNTDYYDVINFSTRDSEEGVIDESASLLFPATFYKIELAVDETMTIPGAKGELRVWIGGEEEETFTPERFVTDTATFPVIRDYALVTPHAPDFEIDAKDETCFKIHSSGSAVRFSLTPKKEGRFDVSANIELFQDEGCTGAPVPKLAETLSVVVTIDSLEVFKGQLGELGSILWGGVLDFWTALVALIVGLVLFLVRKKLAVWFKYTP